MKRGALIALLINLYFNAISQDLLFWGSAVPNEFYSLDLKTNSRNTIATGQNRITRIRVDQNLKQVFWSAQFLNKIQKADANFNGTNIVDVKTNISGVSTIAIDASNNRIYYHLNGGSEILSCDTLGLNTSTVINFGSPISILGIQVVNNELFWSEWSSANNKISKTSLPLGNNISTVYSTPELLFDIVVFPKDSSIYFTNRTGNKIQKINMDGTGLQTLITETNTTAIGTISGDYCNNVLYYVVNNRVSGTNGSKIKRTDLSGSSPITIVDTSFSFLAGIDALYEFNIGKENDFLGTDITICGDSIELNATVNGASYIWNTGETAAKIWVKQTGNYRVTVNLNNCSKFDTINVTLSPASSLNLGADTLLCFGDSIILGATTPNATYLWSDNSTNPTLKIKLPGLYWVDRTESACTSRDSIQVQFGANIQPSIGPDTNLCAGDSITLIANVSVPSATYLWNNNSTSSELKVKQSGIYSVTVTDNNCSKVDSVLVNFIIENFSFGNDTILQVGDSLVLSLNSPNATVLWSDNTNGQTLKVTATGIYWAEVTYGICINSDSIRVIFQRPNSNLISGIINNYSKVNSVGIGFCADTLLLKNPSSFQVGDQIVIAQMQGATASTTNGSIFGDVSNINSVGLHERTFINEIRGDTFIFFNKFINTYDENGSLQIVSFPKFANAIVTDTLTAKDWDGETGGILAFEATNSLILNADINTDGKGFRGGRAFAGTYTQNTSNCGKTDYFASKGNFNGGQKGEGISQLDSAKFYGRGHFSTAGGGGNSSNSGGAGGGNAGVGGSGGNEWFTCGAAAVGGIGGAAFDYASFPERTIMGGGAGSGDANDNLGSSGGNGGGIILIKTIEIIALNKRISSNGISAKNASNDGAGGGGAGGSILLDITNYNSPVTISVDGGNGGNNVDRISCFGTGGGGGSGIIKITGLPPSSVAYSIQTGSSGIITRSPGSCQQFNYGATSGQSGILLRNVQNIFGPTNSLGTFSINIGTDTTLCIGDSLNLDATTLNASYLWSNGVSDSAIVVKQAGKFSVIITINNCSYNDTINIDYFPLLSLKLGTDTTLCPNDTIVLDVTTLSGTYLWSDSSTGPNLSVGKEGLYWVEVINANGCSSRDSVNIQSIPALDNLFLGNDTTLCEGDFIDYDFTQPSYSYLWNDSTSAPTNTISSSGIYWLELTTTNGCLIRDSILIQYKNKPIAELGNDTAICFGEIISSTIQTASISYLWNTGGIDTFITVTSSGDYWLELLDNGCMSRDSINIIVKPTPSVNLGPDTTICTGDTLTLSQPSFTAIYLWNDSTIGNSIKAFQKNNYWLSFTVDGCSARDSIRIETFDTLGASFLPSSATICGDEEEVIQLNLPLLNSTYLWQDGNNNRDYIIADEGDYYVKITNTCGSRIDSIIVTEQCKCEVSVPNMFTPNNDLINDQFAPSISCTLEKYSIEIYSRWGEKVFNSSQQSATWDGTKKGKALKAGVYYYVLNYKAPNEKTHTIKGNILLNR
jgi:gliding motility-associated-like protein